MEFVMPTWMYLSIALVFIGGLYAAKVKWWNPDIQKPMDRESWMMNTMVWVGIVYMGLMWPASAIVLVFFGLALGGYEVYKRFN